MPSTTERRRPARSADANKPDRPAKPAASSKTTAKAAAPAAKAKAAPKTKTARAKTPAGAPVAIEGTEVSIALSALVDDPINVRQQAATEAEDAQLDAGIRAAGRVLQNLVVRAMTDASGQPTGQYGVTAGGRRRASLNRLAAKGDDPRFHADMPVRCLLVDDETALAASYAENAGRAPLHGADLFDAFCKMHDAGRCAQEIADAWGVPLLTVERRLRLAKMAPTLLQGYRDGEVSLDQLAALSVIEAPEQQVEFFNSLPAHQRSAGSIRHMLTRAEVTANDRRAKFVGIEAYERAGGRAVRDLFAGDDSDAVRLLDPQLLATLAQSKLAEHAKANTPVWAKWFEAMSDAEEYTLRDKFHTLPKVTREATAAEAARLTAIGARQDEIQQALEALGVEADDDEAAYVDDGDDGGDGDGDESHVEAAGEPAAVEQDGADAQIDAQIDALTAEDSELDDERRAIETGMQQIATDDPDVGVVYLIGRDGQPQALEGLVRADVWRERQRQARKSRGTVAAEPGGTVAVDTLSYSESVRLRLTAQRTAAVAASLVQQPGVALRLLAAHLVQSVIGGHVYDSRVGISTTAAMLDRHDKDIGKSAAGRALEAEREYWHQALELDRLGFDRAMPLERCLTLDDAQIARLLTFCVAEVYDDVSSGKNEYRTREGLRQTLHAALGLDMRQWWTAADTAFLQDVSKAEVIKAVQQARGSDEAKPLVKLSKGEVVVRAQALLEGQGWLPEILRETTAPQAANAGVSQASADDAPATVEAHVGADADADADADAHA